MKNWIFLFLKILNFQTEELPLSLTFDHQVIDGSPAAEFLSQVVYYLENPYLLVV